jgi:predicted alpha/beta-hydrolase family hydrolase
MAAGSRISAPPTDPFGDCLVLTHGAGANCNSHLLVALGNVFCASGLTCSYAIFPSGSCDRMDHHNVAARNSINRPANTSYFDSTKSKASSVSELPASWLIRIPFYHV